MVLAVIAPFAHVITTFHPRPEGTLMPKQKTHSGTKKRFRVTRNGKVMTGQKNRSHLLEKKNQARKRRLKGETQLSAPAAKKVKRLLNK
jgi:large subunit ribosomal protein L35